MTTRAADRAYGFGKEEECHSAIEILTGQRLAETSRYHPFDYINEDGTVLVELKSRRIRHDQYPTALIGMNKVAMAFRDPTKTYYFCYHYQDGLYYVKFDPDLFRSFQVKRDFVRGARSDCVETPSDILNIPVEHLKFVTV